MKRTKCATLRPRLRCLRRNLGLLGLLGVACVVAAHASAAPAPTLFRLTIVGTAHQEWTLTGAAVVSGDCRRTETSAGTRSACRRVLPVDVRGILGNVTLVGTNTTDEVCGGKTTSNIDDCAQTRRPFTGATVHAASPRPGVVAFKGVANVRLATTDCPREPADVSGRPLGPPLNLVRLPKGTVTGQKLSRINLSATRSRRKVYGSPEHGRLVESVEWTLKFVRTAA